MTKREHQTKFQNFRMHSFVVLQMYHIAAIFLISGYFFIFFYNQLTHNSFIKAGHNKQQQKTHGKPIRMKYCGRF